MNAPTLRALFACSALLRATTSHAAADDERVSPFIQPVPSAALGVLQVGAVSVGVDVPLRPHMMLVAEAFFAKTANDPFGVSGGVSPAPYTRLALSAGVAFFHPSGPGPYQGAFIAPKIVLDGRRYSDPRYQILTRGVGLDLDLGYRWRKGRLTIALVAGLGFSYVINAPYPLLQTMYVEPAQKPANGFNLDINLNILRLGFAF